MSDSLEVTRLTMAAAQGSSVDAAALVEALYDDLRRLAQSYMKERSNGNETLQPTAVVHEAYIRLIDKTRVHFEDEGHFFAAAALAMRHILIDHARARRTVKRGGMKERANLTVALDMQAGDAPGEEIWADVEALDAALTELRGLSDRAARVVELRVFAGLGVDQVARHLGVSERTVKGDWRTAKAWIQAKLSGDGNLPPFSPSAGARP